MFKKVKKENQTWPVNPSFSDDLKAATSTDATVHRLQTWPVNSAFSNNLKAPTSTDTTVHRLQRWPVNSLNNFNSETSKSLDDAYSSHKPINHVHS